MSLDDHMPHVYGEELPAEAVKARWWRQRVAKWRVADMCRYKIGYLRRGVEQFETGRDAAGRLIQPQAWDQYRRAVAAAAGLDPETFDWTQEPRR